MARNLTSLSRSKILSRLSPRGGLSQFRHQSIDLGDWRFARRQRTALSQSGRGVGSVTDRARDEPA
jgi:hypothetical protein